MDLDTDTMLSQHQMAWRRFMQKSPRRRRTHVGKTHVLDLSFTRHFLGKDPLSWYATLMPLIVIGLVVFDAVYGEPLNVLSLAVFFAVWVAVTGFVLGMYNDFRDDRVRLWRRNLVFEPQDVWRENLQDLDEDRSRYVEAVLGARAGLLTLMHGTSMDIDLEAEDREISYIVRKLIHMEELDDAIIKKATKYVERIHELINENIAVIELVMELDNTPKPMPSDSSKRRSGIYLPYKYILWRRPKSLYEGLLN